MSSNAMPRENAEQAQTADLMDHPLSSLRQVVFTWRDTSWQPMSLSGRVLEGFYWQPLLGDQAKAWDAYWMRLEAGAKSPEHAHPSTELLFIHEGTLHDDNGQTYGPGDVVLYAAGSVHSTFSPSGCHALVVTGIHASLL